MRVVILGEGGHARSWRHMLGFADLLTSNDADVLPDDEVHIGIGAIPVRRRLYGKFKAQIPNRGVQWMGNTWEGPNCVLGENLLFNTGVQIDHDCRVANHCVIAPGAILCGNVTLGEACLIGAGAIILQGVELEPKTFIPAASFVVGPDDIRAPIRNVRNDGTAPPSRGTHGQWDNERKAWT